MGKNKLKKFSEMEELPFVLQYPWGRLRQESFPHKGKWNTFFGNNNPVIVELGCGKGEYTVGLAKMNPHANFIGVDVKGARMWTGAKTVQKDNLKNVAFIRTDIEMLPHFFSPGEVDEIWITFPDPQMQKPRKRLTGSRMNQLYRKVLTTTGRINLKTDSPFLFEYTGMLCNENGFKVFHKISDIYDTRNNDIEYPVGLREIKTHYENQWLDRGLTIKFLSYSPFGEKEIIEPENADSIPKDTYRSYSRGYIQMPQLIKDEERTNN